jgi:hypothetical protein
MSKPYLEETGQCRNCTRRHDCDGALEFLANDAPVVSCCKHKLDYEKTYTVSLWADEQQSEKSHVHFIDEENGKMALHETSVDALDAIEALRTAADLFVDWEPTMTKENLDMTIDSWGFTEESINQILDIKGANGELIDVFELYGVLFVGNTKNGEWDLTTAGRFTKYRSDHINLQEEDFDGCHTEEQVQNTFASRLTELITNNL